MDLYGFVGFSFWKVADLDLKNSCREKDVHLLVDKVVEVLAVQSCCLPCKRPADLAWKKVDQIYLAAGGIYTEVVAWWFEVATSLSFCDPIVGTSNFQAFGAGTNAEGTLGMI